MTLNVMPKNSSIQVLRRWQELDAALTRGWLNLRRSAERLGTNERTLKRDIAAFRAMGQTIESARSEPWGEIREYVKRYAPGTKPLFVANLPKEDEDENS